jgi:hypothetical protein
MVRSTATPCVSNHKAIAQEMFSLIGKCSRDFRLAHRANRLINFAKQSRAANKAGLLPPTRKGASADSKPAIARTASDGGSSLRSSQ